MANRNRDAAVVGRTADGRGLVPLAEEARVELLDVVRGFAVFGILLVNTPLFFSPIYLRLMARSWWNSPTDRIVEGLILFIGQGKFYAIFSLLFGIGVALQIERAEGRGQSASRFIARRMLWLLVIGLLHLFFLWYGDILTMYALLGLLLIPFRRRKRKTMGVWILALFLVPILLFSGLVVLVEAARLDPGAAMELERRTAQTETRLEERIEEARLAYSSADLGRILRVRAKQVAQVYTFAFFSAPMILGIFLIGFLLGRERFFHRPERHLPAVRALWGWLLAVGVLGSGATAVLQFFVHPMIPSPLGLVQQVGFVIGATALGFAYVATIVLAWQHPAWRRRLAPLAPVGRTALSNYLLQSLIFTTLANGYGLGLYGRVSPVAGVVLTVGFFALQVWLSGRWLRRFRFGPLEWLWRSLSYGRLQPLLRH